MLVVIAVLFVLLGLLAGFFWIARKGRQLRRSQPLPPEAHHAFLQSTGEKAQEISAPFYFGKSRESDLVLQEAKADYEACIFYHNRRFAIQALTGAGILKINEEEILAGYLRDGDILEIARQKFIFRCY